MILDLNYHRKKYFESGNIAFPIDCPDLIPEYFDLFLNSFLEIQKELLKTMFVEAHQKEIFINKQMLAVKNEIDMNKVKLLKYPQLDIYHKIESIYNSYLKLLENELKSVSNNKTPQQIEPKTENNPFPLMFVNENVYSCFLDYKKHIIEVHTDYSYLKKRLENLKLIHKHTDNDFMNFLLNDIKFISKKDFENYTYKYESKLKSLSKSYSEQRHNNFNIVFENLI